MFIFSFHLTEACEAETSTWNPGLESPENGG